VAAVSSSPGQRLLRYRRRKPVPAVLLILVLSSVAGMVWLNVLGSAGSQGPDCPPPPPVAGAPPSGDVLDRTALDEVPPAPPQLAGVQVLNGNGQRGLGKLFVDDGRLVAGFSAFTDAPVYGLAKHGSTLVAAGKFTTVNNQARASLASVDLVTGALSPWAPARMCTNCATYWDITVSGNTVFVASSGPGGQVGAYDLATGAPQWRYVHTDGDVQAVTVSDGLLYIGGHFNQYVGSNTLANERHQLAALNPATGALDPGFAPRMHNSYPGVWALAATASRLYVGGHFGGVGSPTSNREPYFAMFGAI